MAVKWLFFVFGILAILCKIAEQKSQAPVFSSALHKTSLLLFVSLLPGFTYNMHVTLLFSAFMAAGAALLAIVAHR